MNRRPVDQLIASLGLKPHPEGGFYSETWRSPLQVTPSDDRGSRSALTTIYFLLPAGAMSRWHRVQSDEVWIHIEGAPLELLTISADEWQLQRIVLGALASGQQPVHCVPAGWWQAARSIGDYTLVCCAVGPGFSFDDFEMLKDDAQLTAEISERFPEVRSIDG